MMSHHWTTINIKKFPVFCGIFGGFFPFRQKSTFAFLLLLVHLKLRIKDKISQTSRSTIFCQDYRVITNL